MKPNKEIDKTKFYDIPSMAEVLSCSERHLFNLRRWGQVPQPVCFGERVVWPKKVIERWIEDGCPAIAV